MGLEARLRRLESRVRPANPEPEDQFDLDLCITHLGLVPGAVRELARCKGCSLIEAMCQMLGIELREFKRQLQEVAYGPNGRVAWR